VAVTAAATVLVLAPWVARNWVRFDHPVLSNNAGTTIAGANCPQTYFGPQTGWFIFECTAEHPPRPGNEAQRSARLRKQGLDYARAHAGRLPLISAIRVGHLWGLYEPRRQTAVTGRAHWLQLLGVIAYYPVALLGLAGAWRLRRRRTELAILLIPAAVATIAALTAHGNTRLRHGAEVALVALAGVACAALAVGRRTGEPS
jgi:hypothetical protein